MKYDPGYRMTGSSAEQMTKRAMAWLAPALPSMSPWVIARLSGAPAWTPPGTRPLVRHCAPDGRRLVTGERISPRGYSIEFDLGVVHVHGQPGTNRVLRTPTGFLRTPVEGALVEGYSELGHVEQYALPMLCPLEIRRLPDSGQLTLVSGHADPLFHVTEYVETIGFVDGYPIEPRQVQDRRVFRHTVGLWRTLDPGAFRHDYAVTNAEPANVVAELGGIWNDLRPGFVPLRRRADGVIASGLLSPPQPTSPSPKEAARWIAAPLTWPEGKLPERWSVRASARRAVQVVKELPERPRPMGEDVILGYLRAEPRRDWKPLFSATHAVSGDQFLTRSPLEASDMGYRVDGLLGYVSTHVIDLARTGVNHEVRWASRFGQRRRYIEPPHTR